jgi:hypothetical protein
MGSEYGIVESILASVQWDRWKFMLSAPKLVKQDVAVISHGHRDHWATNLAEKDIVLVPRDVGVSKGSALISNIVPVDYSVRIGKLNLVLFNRQRLRNFLRMPIPKPHTFWWMVDSKTRQQRTRVVFIGDLNMEDVSVARALVAELFKRDLPIHGSILPSFGGVSRHNTESPMQLAIALEGLAHEFHDVHGITIAALPHPVSANWADYNATQLQSIID